MNTLKYVTLFVWFVFLLTMWTPCIHCVYRVVALLEEPVDSDEDPQAIINAKYLYQSCLNIGR